MNSIAPQRAAPPSALWAAAGTEGGHGDKHAGVDSAAEVAAAAIGVWRAFAAYALAAPALAPLFPLLSQATHAPRGRLSAACFTYLADLCHVPSDVEMGSGAPAAGGRGGAIASQMGSPEGAEMRSPDEGVDSDLVAGVGGAVGADGAEGVEDLPMAGSAAGATAREECGTFRPSGDEPGLAELAAVERADDAALASLATAAQRAELARVAAEAASLPPAEATEALALSLSSAGLGAERWRVISAYLPAALSALRPPAVEYPAPTALGPPPGDWRLYEGVAGALHFVASYIQALHVSPKLSVLEAMPWAEAIARRHLLPFGSSASLRWAQDVLRRASLGGAAAGGGGGGGGGEDGPAQLLAAVELLLGHSRLWWHLSRLHRGLLRLMTVGGPAAPGSGGAGETVRALWRTAAALTAAMGADIVRGRPAADGAGHATPAALVAAERGRRGLRVSSSRLGHMVAKLLDALHAAHPSEVRLAALAAAQIEAPLSPAAPLDAAAVAASLAFVPLVLSR